VALAAIHARFSPAYGPAAGNTGFYAMDIEFEFDDEANPGSPPTLYVKQARPYPGRGTNRGERRVHIRTRAIHDSDTIALHRIPNTGSEA